LAHLCSFAVSADTVIDPVAVLALGSLLSANRAVWLIAALLVAEVGVFAQERPLEVAARVFVEAVDMPSRVLVEFPQQQGVGRPGCFVVQRRVGCPEVIEVEDRKSGRAGKCQDVVLVGDVLPRSIASRMRVRKQPVHVEHP
jgi:hypothetical protein